MLSTILLPFPKLRVHLENDFFDLLKCSENFTEHHILEALLASVKPYQKQKEEGVSETEGKGKRIYESLRNTHQHSYNRA